VVEAMVLMLSPLTPHVAEELYEKLGGDDGSAGALAFVDFPSADAALLVEDTVEIPVQVNGKVRGRISIAADASQEAIEAAARADAKVAELLEGATVRKVVVVPGRMVNFVVG